MKKLRSLDLSSTSELTVLIQGVPVVVNLDANGWPCSARTAAWVGGEEERLATLAAMHVIALQRLAAQESEKARGDAKRTKESTKTKREQAAEHFSAHWFAKVYEKNPGIGALRLARKTRQLLAMDYPEHPDNARRKECSEHRAREFLKAKRQPRDL